MRWQVPAWQGTKSTPGRSLLVTEPCPAALLPNAIILEGLGFQPIHLQGTHTFGPENVLIPGTVSVTPEGKGAFADVTILRILR